MLFCVVWLPVQAIIDRSFYQLLGVRVHAT
jgi:hypothetical protein